MIVIVFVCLFVCLFVTVRRFVCLVQTFLFYWYKILFLRKFSLLGGNDTRECEKVSETFGKFYLKSLASQHSVFDRTVQY